MDYSTQRIIRLETGFNSVYGEPLQVSWNRRIRNSLYAYTQIDGVKSIILRIPTAVDIMRICKLLNFKKLLHISN